MKTTIMKALITILIFVFTIHVNAQLTIDDFSSGELKVKEFKDRGPAKLHQTGTMVGKNRSLEVYVNQSIDSQKLQLGIENNKLTASFGYNTKGVIKVNYGYSKNGLAPMNLKLKKYKSIKVEFEAKSSTSSINVGLFTNSDRAVWAGKVKARPGILVVTIPFSDLKIIGNNFNIDDVDFIIFQFNADSITGHNFAIKRIWIE